MKSRDRSTALAVIGCAAALALAACGGATVVSQPYYDYSFASSELGYASTFGPIPVVLRGSAPAGPEAQALVAAINSHRSSPPVFAAPGAATRSPYALVLAFGQEAGNANYCAGGDGFGRPGQITGAFCLGPRVRAQAVASGGPGGAPQLDAAVNGLVTALLSPDTDYNRRRGVSTARPNRR